MLAEIRKTKQETKGRQSKRLSFKKHLGLNLLSNQNC